MVEHRDRLPRFGGAQIAQALRASRRTLVVIDPSELVQDMLDLMTCFSARHGRRSAKNRARRAAKALSE